jgi:hypothetical protein
MVMVPRCCRCWSVFGQEQRKLPAEPQTSVKRGIYVLFLDGGLCVSYTKGTSRVLYSRKGKLRGRIQRHLDKKLLDFFLQIPGVEFRFYMTEPKKSGPGRTEYFHDLEQ